MQIAHSRSLLWAFLSESAKEKKSEFPTLSMGKGGEVWENREKERKKITKMIINEMKKKYKKKKG